MEKDYQKYIAELIGTFVLVTVGFGAVCFGNSILIGAVGLLGVAVAFGMALMVMAYTIGPISGCHVNPAVSVAMYINKKITEKDLVFYIVMQIIGAVLGSVVIITMLAGAPNGEWDGDLLAGVANGYDKEFGGFSVGAALLMEVVTTFIFLLVIFGATSKKVPAGFAPIPIGVVLAILIMVAGPVTNASLNPARSLAPAMFVGGDIAGQVWLFFVGPIIGAVLAALAWRFVLDDDAEMFKPAPQYPYPPVAQPAPQAAPVQQSSVQPAPPPQ